MSFLDVEAFEDRYCVEDGPIEWLTVAGFAVGGIICLRRAWVLRRRRSLRFVALTCLLGLAFIFCAGEEISWGQRLLGVESSDWFRTYNAQQETNLHNIRIGDVKINKLVFSKGIGLVLVLYFAVLVPLYGRRAGLRRIVDANGIPIPKLHQVIAIVIMFVLTQGLVRSTNKGELAEFGAAFLFTLLVALPTNGSIFRASEENGDRLAVDQ
jgi:hypothetical protein